MVSGGEHEPALRADSGGYTAVDVAGLHDTDRLVRRFDTATGPGALMIHPARSTVRTNTLRRAAPDRRPQPSRLPNNSGVATITGICSLF